MSNTNSFLAMDAIFFSLCILCIKILGKFKLLTETLWVCASPWIGRVYLLSLEKNLWGDGGMGRWGDGGMGRWGGGEMERFVYLHNFLYFL
ncbi:MAG: hypothetical protein F6K24_08510 [Okeania sp. SIO2D1]|nr:hypothetical protein [Okeania sp. SIO2D1]